ncbi:glycosyltransferase [Coleofasciculus sp. H7-2]|uniref:glycosyltransferase n=1 Tax=Coleofasciculus sp. H7-2 TaxID=3351545 RepID=UPI00366D3FA9
MKVAIFVDRFPVISETFILNQITGLIERGHEVEIYSIYTNKAGNLAKVHPDVKTYRLLEQTYCAEVPDNFLLRALKGFGLLLANFYKKPVLLLRSLNIFKYSRSATSLKLLYATILLMKRQTTYDVIHCQFGHLGLMAMALRELGVLQGKLITHFRGSDISKYIQQVGEDAYEPLFKTGDLFLSNCDFFKRRLVKLGCEENKIIVFGSGIDCSRFRFSPRYPHPDGRIKIVTTGRLVEKKGVEYGIRAVTKLANTYPNIEYNIVGDGPLLKELQQLIQILKVEHSVHLIGRKQQQELIELLNNSHIFIAPCVTAKDGNQDAPVNTLKEAMAMGLPVVSTQHGGIPELVEDGISGFLVPERDADALAEKLGYLIAHSEVWPEMGQAGRAYVEQHYNLDQLNDYLVEIYKQLLNQEIYSQNKLPALDGMVG